MADLAVRIRTENLKAQSPTRPSCWRNAQAEVRPWGKEISVKGGHFFVCGASQPLFFCMQGQKTGTEICVRVALFLLLNVVSDVVFLMLSTKTSRMSEAQTAQGVVLLFF